MKFNEKLISLRKREGLSQEELGYKLNVTRQTVSKWELGQTTPEMDKLSELSKIFNISVDQLINESEITNDSEVNPINNKIEDQPIQEKGGKNNKTIIILVAILFIVIAVIGWKLLEGFIGLSIFNKSVDKIKDLGKDMVNQGFGTVMDAYDGAINKMESNSDTINTGDMLNNIGSNLNQMTGIINNNMNSSSNEEINNVANKVAVGQFNGQIELFAGTSNPSFVVQMLDNIITSNKKNDRKITVKYNKTETQDESKIRTIKQTINKSDAFQDFEIICEYDAQGYIYKVIIEKV